MLCHGGCLSDDALEHHGECLTAVDRRVGRPFEDGAHLIPDGFPLGTLTLQVEFGEDAFEPVDQFGMALKPWIGATLVKKGFDLIHNVLRGVPFRRLFQLEEKRPTYIARLFWPWMVPRKD
jgi:hypothetical protein